MEGASNGAYNRLLRDVRRVVAIRNRLLAPIDYVRLVRTSIYQELPVIGLHHST